MMIHRLLACLLVLVCAQTVRVFAIEIGANGSVSGSFGGLEEESRFFPGTYFFRKGCDAYRRGNLADAISLWKQAASWGHKSAQYNLGIAYYKGRGVDVDVPLGLAWLGLSAERHEARFQDSMDAAWYQASVKERVDAKKEYALLKPVYGDAVALKRAWQRFDEERRNITGSHLGAVGNLTIYAAGNTSGKNGALYMADLERKADEYFNSSSGTVSVGDLMPLTDPADAGQPQ